VLHVALEIPLGLLLIGGGAQGHLAAAGVEKLGDALDRAPIANRIPALKQQDQAIAYILDLILHLHQLHLQAGQFLFIELAIELG